MNYQFSATDYMLSPWPMVFVLVIMLAIHKSSDTLFMLCITSLLVPSMWSLSSDILPGIYSIRLKKEILFGILGLASCLYFYVKPIKKQIIDWLFYANLALTIITFLLGSSVRGMGMNTSVNATCLVIMFACWQQGRSFSIIIAAVTFVALCLDKTSMGVIAFCAGLILYSPRLLFAVVPLAIVAVFHYGDEFYSLSSRGGMWEIAIEFYRNNKLYWGTGWGSFAFMGPYIQTIRNSTGAGYFVTLHSDILQTAMEAGFIGVTAWAVYFARGVISRDPAQRLFFTTVFVSMIGNFPLRVPLSAAFIFWGMGYLDRRRNGREEKAPYSVSGGW